jgi:hypothetical protein
MSHDSKQITTGPAEEDGPEVEQAWIEEAERRYAEYLAGGIEVIPASEALAQVRAERRW